MMGVHSQLLAAVFLFASLSSTQKSAPPIQDVLADTKNLGSFRDLLTTQFSELEAILSTQKQFSSFATLLAPSDDAFDRLVSSSFGPALADNDTDTIRSLFNYHTVPGDHSLSTVNQSFGFFPTLLDDATYTNVTGGQRLGLVKQGKDELIVISGGGTRSKVEQKDIFFEGGVMHVIGSSLLPPQPLVEAAVAFNLSSFLGALYQNESLGEFVSEARDLTLFVPNNVAFETIGSTVTSIDEASLSQLLEYHIILGEGGPFFTPSFTNGTVFKTLQGQNITTREASNSVFVNSARMLQTDLLIANGVMHVIDNVLSPNATGAEPDPALGTQVPAMSGSNVADTPFTDVIPSLTEAATVSASSTGDLAAGTGGGSRTSSTRTSSTMDTESSPSGAAPRVVRMSTHLIAQVCGMVAFWMYV